MGLIKAVVGAVGGTLADQWKEFFYCDSLGKDTLVVKGQKRIGSRSSNTKGSDNIISNGSGIAVADGQCMIIVEQGKVVEVCAEPGQFTYDSSTEPSIFAGKLGKSIVDTFKTMGRRIAYGGDTGKDQRVYYFNTKEIIDNKFGTPNPVPFRVVDSKIGMDLDVSLKCSGVYSYRLVNPIIFYTNICGNVAEDYMRSEIDGQLKTEFISALQPALAKLSDLEIRPNQIPAHVNELQAAMREVLNSDWLDRRGIQVETIAMNPPVLPEQDQKDIREAQRAGMFRDPSMAAGNMTAATGDAMRTAAGNPNGAMMGFMGMGMAQGQGAQAATSLYGVAAQQQAKAEEAATAAADTWTCPKCGKAARGKFCPECGEKKPEADGWTCPKCGKAAHGKFCPECGEKKPDSEGWTCSKCGTVNKGKFCSNCGEKKPAGVPTYRCDKCGWEPEDPHNPPKFCPSCGDKFDDDDMI